MISAITVTTTTALRLPEEVEEYSLPSAIRTVSKTPADVVGLTDRGEIAARKCADPVRVHQAGSCCAQRVVWRKSPRMTTLTSPPTTPTSLIGPARFVLIVGPSDAGKDTLIAGARTACADAANVAFPRRVVTRAISDAEDHDSLDVAYFDRAVEDGSSHCGGKRTATNMEYQVMC